MVVFETGELRFFVQIAVAQRADHRMQLLGGPADVHDDAVGVESFGSEGGIHDVRRAVQALRGPEHGPSETVRDHHVVADRHAEHASPSSS